MTSQTKKFVELSDIIAFRFECSKRYAYATIPCDNFQKDATSLRKLWR